MALNCQRQVHHCSFSITEGVSLCLGICEWYSHYRNCYAFLCYKETATWICYQVTQNKENDHMLSQGKYILDLLKEIRIEAIKPCLNPVSSSLHWKKLSELALPI